MFRGLFLLFFFRKRGRFFKLFEKFVLKKLRKELFEKDVKCEGNILGKELDLVKKCKEF